MPPYQHVRSIGEDVSAAELLLPEGHRLRATDVAAAAAAGATQLPVRRRPRWSPSCRPGTRSGRSANRPAARRDHRHQLAHARHARPARPAARRDCLPIEPDDCGRIGAAVSAAAPGCDLLIVVAGSSAGRDDYTAQVVAELGTLAVHGVAVRPGHPVVLGVVDRTPVLGAPGYPVSAALTFDIFAEPLLRRAGGRHPAPAPADHGPAGPQARLPLGMDDWVRVRLGMVGGAMVATRRCRAARAC